MRNVGLAMTVGIFALGAMSPGSAIPPSSGRTPAPDSARVAFGLPATVSGEQVPNDYGMPLTGDEVSRLEKADILIERARGLARLLDLSPSEFGGLWFDRTRDTLVVQLVKASAQTREVVKTFDLGGPIETRDVRYTLGELEAVHADLVGRVSDGSLAMADLASVGVDARNNQVRVEVLRGTATATRNDIETASSMVAVVDGERPRQEVGCTSRLNCYPPLKAGLDIWRSLDHGNCTSGFVYQNASYSLGGTKGKVLTTAGHCAVQVGQVGATWQHGSPAVNIGQVFLNANSSGTDADVMFIDIPDTWGSNDVFRSWIPQAGGPSIQNITSRGCADEIGGNSCEVIGETVCYAGRSTGYRCGVLQDINIDAFDDHGLLKRHNRTVSPNPSIGGDSGAPAFYGAKAKGHLWGGTSSVWVYSHIWYVADLCSWNTTCLVQIAN